MFKNLTQTTLRPENIRYVTKNISIMSIGHVAGVLIAVLSAYVFANYLDKGTYGSYQFVLAIGPLLSILTLRGVEKQIIRLYTKSGVEALMSRTYQFLIYSLPATAIGVFIGSYFLYKGNETLFFSIVALALTFPIIKSLGLYNAPHLAREEYAIGTIKGIVHVAVPSIAVVIAILLNTDLLGLVLTFFASQLITTLLLFIHTLLSKNIDIFVKPESTADEFHISASQSIMDIAKVADKFIIFSLLGAASLAIYTIASLPMRELSRLNTIIRMLVVTKFSKHAYVQVRAKVLEKTALIFIFYALVAALYILIAPAAFQFIFPQYMEAVFYTQLLALLLPLSSCFLLTEMLTIFDKTHELYVINISTTILQLGLIAIGAFYFGITGLIVARLISLVYYFLIQIYMSFRTS